MNNLRTKQTLNYEQILDVYVSGCKKEMKIGLEFERLPISSSTNHAVSYYSDYGICNFLRTFAKAENWDYITDDYNIIGLKHGHDTITLEPGSQIELSLEPQKSIFDMEKKIENLDKKMKPILDKMGITLLSYGISPLATHKFIDVIPKRRYEIMAKYLWGILSDVMMRETAGIQVCIDYKSEDDAMRKFRIANKLSPFITAMFANSPVRGGVETGYKSFRALSWLNTDNDRCGFACDMQEDLSFYDYIEYVLNTPIIFIDKNNEHIKLNGKINFKEYMLNGWNEFGANIEDYLLHANLCFPDVRLRNFIEIRNHDCGNKMTPYSVMAIYKGIMYNETAMSDIEELLKDYKQSDFTELRYEVPKSGLDAEINGNSIKDVAKEILRIARTSLTNEGLGEEKYLDYISEYTEQGICPADVIIKNWNGSWRKDIRKLIEYNKH